jgi:hypothetical protein
VGVRSQESGVRRLESVPQSLSAGPFCARSYGSSPRRLTGVIPSAHGRAAHPKGQKSLVMSPPRKRGSTSVWNKTHSRFRGNDWQRVIFAGGAYITLYVCACPGSCRTPYVGTGPPRGRRHKRQCRRPPSRFLFSYQTLCAICKDAPWGALGQGKPSPYKTCLATAPPRYTTNARCLLRLRSRRSGERELRYAGNPTPVPAPRVPKQEE